MKKHRKEGSEGVSVKRFALTYLILMGVFFFLIGFRPIQDFFDINGLYTRTIVFLTARVLALFHIYAHVDGSVIRLPSIALDVKFGCNGLEAVMIYSVAVIAFPARWTAKVAGIIAGFFLIQVINVLRIAGLAYSGVYYRALFDIIHIYVAQGVMIAVSLGVFLVYLRYAGRGGVNYSQG